MKTNNSTRLALLPVVLMALASCATTMSGEEDVAVMETKTGAIVVDTFTTDATVVALDGIKRKVTLETPDGKKTKFKAGPEVANFDQLQVGDQVHATVTEELALSLRPSDAPPSAAEAATVALTPVGAKPGMLMADTIEITVKITAVDSAQRKVTFEFADGTTKELKVGKEADLDRVKPGDDVIIRMTEGIAILVEKA
jgi:hypothetical protein